MLKPIFAKTFYLWNSLLFISIPTSMQHYARAAKPIPDHSYSHTISLAAEEFPVGKVDSNKTRTFVSKAVGKHVSRNDVFHSPKVKLNKKGVKFVNNYIRKSHKRLYKIKKRSEIPFEIIDSVFERYGLPSELRYLAVVESELRTSATSRVGAKGPWQLMPETAQILGLKVDQDCDERTDYYKSTPAAARYLKDLYAQFGDWLLVLAAYNGGPAPIHHAIRRSGSRNFWVLQRYLPTETRRHVKRFIATHYYFEGHGSVTTLTKAERINYLKTVQHFENSHPVVETKAKKEKTQRPAKPMAAPKKNPAQEGTVAISKPNTEIPANEPGLLKNPAAESENDKFKRIMVNAESAILQSSTVLTPGKQQ